MAVQFMKTMKIDPEAAALLLETFGDVEPDEIAGVATETLIVCGREDRDNGSPVALAELLPNGRFAEIPGTHMSCVTMPELGNAMADFLNRSEERRVGKECVRTVDRGGRRFIKKKKKK